MGSPSEITGLAVNILKHPHWFTSTRFNKRHVALKLAYIGWDYHGFAVQVTAENTIEVGDTSRTTWSEYKQSEVKYLPCI